MNILSPNKINKPRTPHLIHSGQTEKDWHTGQDMLGGTEPREVICPERDWVPSITEYELQRNSHFDSYTCVTQSHWNGIQAMANKRYQIKLDESKRWTAVKAGTIPGRGTSVQAVSECIRTMGGVPESVYPTMTPEMTEDVFYQVIPADVDTKQNFIPTWSFNHEWVARSSPFASSSTMEECWKNLQYSPIVVCVDGEYRFNSNGELQYGGYTGPFIQYTHAVLLVGGEYGKYATVLDSENPTGLMKVEWGYKFGYPKILYVKKKSMFQLVRKNGTPAVYLLCENSGQYYGIADSEEITGGDLLKTFSGTYKNASIAVVDDIPADKIVGEIKAAKFNS